MCADVESRIPVSRLRRCNSLRLRGEKTQASTSVMSLFPTIAESPERWRHGQPRNLQSSSPTPYTDCSFTQDDDLDSLRSFGSACSAISCDHAHIARNGTTFSGRRMKYVVHCTGHSGETDSYLTPTQRATRQVRRLKALLAQAQKDLEQKDNDIFRLTKEVVELRLFKASSTPSSPDSPDLTVAAQEEEGVTQSAETKGSPSLADSGHFEDLTASPEPPRSDALERRLEELQRSHVDECQQMKERHNDRVEGLLQRLSDANNKYCELRADYDRAQDRVRELEKEVEGLSKGLDEQEDRHKSMYLKMYMKGQEAARFEHADEVLEFAHQAPTRVSVPELLQQLQVTEAELENIKDKDHQQTDKSKPSLLSAKEAVSLWLLGTRKAMYRRIVESHAKRGDLDPEITLQFLKSAIYYFLTDKENHQGHLNAIESILGFSDTEKLNIEKAYRACVRK